MAIDLFELECNDWHEIGHTGKRIKGRGQGWGAKVPPPEYHANRRIILHDHDLSMQMFEFKANGPYYSTHSSVTYTTQVE